MPEPTPKIFISYAWKNQTIAKRLQSDLQRDGVEVFVDYEKISGGDSLPERISAALEWCNTLVLLWSADSAQSYYVSQEWTSAFHLQKRIIACVLDGAPLPALLAGRLYLNFTPYETGYAQLCRSLGVTPKMSAEKTPPPEAPKSKLPPQHVEMPVPQLPDEKRESPLPKRKSVADAFRRKPKSPEPTSVLKPPEVFDDTNATEMAMPSRWSRRKIVSVIIGIIAISFLIGKIICKEPAPPISTPTKPEKTSPSQTVQHFRDKPATLSVEEVNTMLTKYGFYDALKNKNGKGISHRYKPETIAGGKIVHDEATGLTWQQSGSLNYTSFADAEKYVRDLNAKKLAGYDNWRLPTLEEAMSLIEPKEPDSDLYIDLLFDRKQSWIWTADRYSAGRAWYVYFGNGSCDHFVVDGYVRAVRS